MFIRRNLIDVYDESNIPPTLKKVEEKYRPHSAGKYLYKCILNYERKNKFSEDFMELLYATLDAWGMNSRGAGLKEFKEFCTLVQNQKENLLKLESYDIRNFNECKSSLETVFVNMQLSKSNAQLVTISKTLHFLLPKLIVPVDRNYTLKFYRGQTNIPKKIENQFALFAEIHTDFSNFASKIDLSQYVAEDSYCCNITKILDSLVIAQKLQ
ncbi:hypothetical protein [Treponema sp.]|uniref:hypothetical protein n=1 Tax=Treponema sp. TaxID=166 RepID=UPI003F039B5E